MTLAASLVLLQTSSSQEPVTTSEKQPPREFTYEERRKRFELFTRCEPINLLVEPLEEAERKTGLTIDSLVAAAESRLRSARLFNDDADPFIYLNVHVVDSSVSVNLDFFKYLYDTFSDEVSYSATWSKEMNGTHGGSGSIRIYTV